jgi:hypothetical protein
MPKFAALFALCLLAGCQVYAGGGTLVSDGRTTTVRTGEVEAGTRTGPRASARHVVIEEE